MLTTTKLMIDRELADLDVRILIERAYRRLNELTEALAGDEAAAAAGSAAQYAQALRWYTGGTGTTTPVSPEAGALVNTGTTAFSRGDLIGISGGVPVKARAGTARAGLVALSAFGAGETMDVASAGLLEVRVASASTPSPGDAAYLSASEAGRVTATRPTSAWAQLIGQFWTPRNAASGLARVALHLDLQHSRGL